MKKIEAGNIYRTSRGEEFKILDRDMFKVEGAKWYRELYGDLVASRESILEYLRFYPAPFFGINYKVEYFEFITWDEYGRCETNPDSFLNLIVE